ncbi:hypothetical protein SAMN05216390_10622 [Lachnospiraceae bacterium KH1T2]|nr:hypothetical protein SAMN05216390_10622 [Lachnospiraceae bacterium KH1T2]
MYKDLLPIGSIVRLKEGTKKLMITGRIICRAGSDEIFDYVGCTYPEGLTDAKNMLFFNRDAIEEKFFIGFQDKEEIDFREQVLANLGELEVVDGKIVQKEN